MRGGRGGGHPDARNVHAQGKSHGTDGMTESSSIGASINAENKITPANRLMSGGVSKVSFVPSNDLCRTHANAHLLAKIERRRVGR